MYTKLLGVGVIVILLIIGPAGSMAQQETVSSQEITVTRASGGSVQINLGYGIILNEGSSLEREWVTIHDPSLPLELIGTIGVVTDYRDGYVYRADFDVRATEALSAIEIRFLTFDLWGEHVKTLSETEIVDFEAGEIVELSPRWNLFSENECSEHYASIAYVARVRTSTGQVLYADPTVVIEEARRFSDAFTSEDLSPSIEK